MLRTAATLHRSLACARPLVRARAALPSAALPFPSAVAYRAHAAPAALLHASARQSADADETTNLRASAGSGQGGKADKERARKDKERARKEREKERAAREKERERARKLKEKERKDKDKARALKLREQERAKARKDKEKADKLKAKTTKKPRTTSALHPPKGPQNSWQIFLSDFIADKKASLAEGEKLASVSALTQVAKPAYQELSAEDKAALQERAEEQRRAYPAILDAWKKTLTPADIREENAVRTRRRKLGLSRKANLRLEGEPKKPMTPYFLFAQEIRAQGLDSDVLRGQTDILEQTKLIAQAWRDLDEAQKKPYHDTYAEARERYNKEKADFDAQHAATEQ
ncbi:hypothetical protein Rhopal_000838-T1 [Rhodotorula paludigena]|uniref:HMG box domain-containing protein n=1 Tax=Rhodotorula paludigena TaxID=86838 RepID=A0AAV5GCR5_9BASI|nr:hypothetical protein Rhopal_000838-T1 [Rhodotorula paludigena]